jgi:hypothetical protein
LQNSSEGWILLIFQSKCGTPHLLWVEHPGESRSLVCNFPMFDKIPYQQMPPDVEHLQADRRRTRPKPVPLINGTQRIFNSKMALLSDRPTRR